MTELYWLIQPTLGEWADVASFDPPGVGREPPQEGPVLAAIAKRGLRELEDRSWTRCVVVGDAYGAAAAIAVASLARERIAGLALGHATLSYRRHGPRAPINPEVAAAVDQLMEVDYRAALRQEVAVWDPRRGGRAEPPPDELVERIAQRLPASTATGLADALMRGAEAAGDLEPTLRELGLPLLLAKHEGCVSHTDEGFEDAVAAFPNAQTVTCPVRPAQSAEFAAALCEFCGQVR